MQSPPVCSHPKTSNPFFCDDCLELWFGAITLRVQKRMKEKK